MTTKRLADKARANPTRVLRVLPWTRPAVLIGSDWNGTSTNAPDEFVALESIVRFETQVTFGSAHGISLPASGLKVVKYVHSPQSIAATHSNELVANAIVHAVVDSTHLWMAPLAAGPMLPCSGLTPWAEYYLQTDGSLGTSPAGRYHIRVGQASADGSYFHVDMRVFDTKAAQWL